MTPLILTAAEAALAAADKLTEIRRPVEGLPPNPVNVRHLGGGYLKCDAPPGSDTVSLRIQCPWGGEELFYAREAWAAHWMYGNLAPELSRSTHPDDNYWYRADGAHAPGSHGCPAHGRRGPWREAETMPVWASRFAYCGRVRVELTGGVWQWVLAMERVNREDGAPVPPVECQ